jgi:hypothetical protein
MPIPDHFILPIGPINGVEFLTGHCAARFRERVGMVGTHATVLLKVEEWLRRSKPARLKPKYEAAKILAHGKPATYRMFNGFVLVITGNTLVTVYLDEAKETEIVV